MSTQPPLKWSPTVTAPQTKQNAVVVSQSAIPTFEANQTVDIAPVQAATIQAAPVQAAPVQAAPATIQAASWVRQSRLFKYFLRFGIIFMIAFVVFGFTNPEILRHQFKEVDEGKADDPFRELSDLPIYKHKGSQAYAIQSRPIWSRITFASFIIAVVFLLPPLGKIFCDETGKQKQ